MTAKPEIRSNSFVKFYQSKNATHVRDREKSDNLLLNMCEPPPSVLVKNPYLNRKFDEDPQIDLLPIELHEMS